MNKYQEALDKLCELGRKELTFREICEMEIAVEYLQRLVEKATPKKPDYEGDGYADGYMVYDTWICPCCEKHYEVDYDDYDYCPNCGQALDWKVEEPSNE